MRTPSEVLEAMLQHWPHTMVAKIVEDNRLREAIAAREFPERPRHRLFAKLWTDTLNLYFYAKTGSNL